ncbi:MAG: hypothetical protein KI788_22000, partial [Mameliella sp.]|nr:hypothetical protein [Mameliella sp.]
AEYRNARARAMRKFLGREIHSGSNSLYTKRNVTTGNVTKVINTMHVADELRIPYAMFFDAIYEHLMQVAGYAQTWNLDERLRKRAPVPSISHFRHASALVAAQETFEKTCLVKLPMPKHPSYKAENWDGTKSQVEFATWLCGEAKRREGNTPYVLRRMIDDGFLHEREVLRSFGADMVKTVRAIVD